jgi:hypothetical protein
MMMPRHLEGKPNTWNSLNLFSSTRMNLPSMDGVPLLLETLNWCALSLSAHVTDVESGTRMVWECIASPRPSLGKARWNISPSNRPLGFVKSKPSKPLMLGSLAKSQISKDDHT